MRYVALVALFAVFAAQSLFGQSALEQVPPASVGMSEIRLVRIDDYLSAEVAAGRIPGAVVAIARRGKLVHLKAIGFQDPVRRIPMRTDAIFPIASLTKPLTTVSALQLYELGKIRMGAPVSEYLGQIGRPVVVADPSKGDTKPARRPPTVQDLLRHTSGMPYGDAAGDALARRFALLDSMAPASPSGEWLDSLSKLPLYTEPGVKWQYGLGMDITGLIIEKLTGQTLEAYMKEHILTPLGMRDTGFHLTKDQASRVALPFAMNPVTKAKQVVPTEGAFDCGGGCAWSTASDYVTFVEALLNGGSWKENRILGPRTVAYMLSDQLPAGTDVSELRDVFVADGYGFGLGVAVRRTDGVASMMGSRGDFFWGGSWGAYFWAEPEQELAVVVMMSVQGPQRRAYRELVRVLVDQAIDE